jgi:hypothetical protein
MARKRVLLIGAGRRGQNAFLPCFGCLGDLFEVRGIYARTAAKVIPIAERWNIQAVTDLQAFDLSSIDLVVVTVPPSQNLAVLKILMPHASRLRLLIDTPIASNTADAQQMIPLLSQFESVTVGEDHMNFPFHALTRKAVAEGLIGRPRSLSLFQIGYLYHGLSIIRSFVGFAPATSSWRKQLGSHGNVIGYEFANGFRATMVGPYRRQDKVGGILVEGTEGMISESSQDAITMGRNKQMFLLQPLRPEGVLTGYRLASPEREMILDLPHLATMCGMNLADKSEINLIQNCALIDVILSVFHHQNLNCSYGYENGIYDSIASLRAEGANPELNPLRLLSS